MKRRIVFATGNENKMKEIRMILADLGMEIVSMREAGVDEEIVEDGMSFEENAEIKARAVSRVLVNDIVLADDSGLEIDYLDKAPGIYSARFAGEDTGLYREFGESFRKLDSWSAYMITSYEDAERYFGRKADKNRKIYNGILKTYFYQFQGPKPPRPKK